MLDFCAARGIAADIEMISADRRGLRPDVEERCQIPLRDRHGFVEGLTAGASAPPLVAIVRWRQL